MYIQFYTQCLKKGEHLVFTLSLYGWFEKYAEAAVETLLMMCRLGMGTPLVRLNLLSVSERLADGTRYCLVQDNDRQTVRLQNPVTLGRYIRCKMEPDEQVIGIHYDVPVNLHPTRRHKFVASAGYTDHRLPGFYQLVKAAALRITKLSALYTYPENADYFTTVNELVEPFSIPATAMELTSATIRRVTCYRPDKEVNWQPVPMAEYTGTLEFTGNCNYYIPLLLFARNLGVGVNTIYGLDRYRLTK
ncbi:MAG: hypothetical protein LIO97_08770 [Tannerellaceae bacterium]|nr:hypothetical protein [Tannerellaceae bacterium]